MTSSAGELLDLDITGFAHGGTAIARHEGRVVFVADAIPGERVRVRVADASKPSFWRADAVEVLEASPHRVPHIWPEADISRDPADRVGGADLGHIELGHQRVLKRQVLQEALDKFAGAGLNAPEVAGLDDSDGTGWRTRMTLHVDDAGRVGPYAARSHRVIEVGSLPLARPELAEAAGALVGTPSAGRIVFVEPADGRARVLPRPDRPTRSRRGARAHRREPEVIVEKVGSREFRLDVDGFWQVHPLAAATLDAEVRAALEGRVDPDATHFDLYGGVGLFAAALADLGATDVVTVESDARATAHAEQNLAPLDVHAVTARVDRFLASGPAGSRAGTIVLDPPRAGAGKAVVEAVHGLDPEAIVYVACDPVALARDLGTFRALGWEADSLRAFDLFPHSHHFETVVRLTR
ncbi:MULTISPECIES: class I SAM-dependent RNA methyltransferase [unclassified Microbacterium]|uniref:class I SAM-dependent RNA methyltransferase n=1 Tax=unclassified Microbacterium TaxID=2609290 RepID=UPI0012FB1DC6|nr:TRAM domain-containing protein [Microbacterium sp. MAH-37]MVQ41080.1 class I SAM-dependent RNA methyltransferase [Microbacterium sp. MAH-37]